MWQRMLMCIVQDKRFTSLEKSQSTLGSCTHLTFMCPLVTRYLSILLSFLVLNWQIICEIGAVLKWTEPQALTLNASKGIGWLTATVMPLTRANASLHVWHMCNGTCGGRTTWAMLALKVGVKVDVEFTGNACCCCCCEVVGTPTPLEESISGKARKGCI